MKKVKESVKKRKMETAKLFGGKCAVCHKRYGRGFTFHHIRYAVGDKKYSDFRSNEKYNEYVLGIVAREPNRFALLCQGHHRMVEMLKLLKHDKYERLLDLVKVSRRG